MSYRVLGVGVGVFILIVLWICAICLAFAFSKAKRPTSFLGFGCIFLAFLVTIILLCIPRGKQVPDPVVDLLEPDYLFIWKNVLLAFLSLSFLVSIIFMVIEHLAVSKPAKSLKKVTRKTIVCDSN
ncbi:hypothetical protein CDAR_499601 [Caerostris darwini]|uniref:Transmembrane protein 218 n=1 Tax=Caerostris darwini TaxID=1538125 RepID=A0AAV4TR41_9ARAC|nr:hypothetical protein CDAR_499601 [Caerostris darwini]